MSKLCCKNIKLCASFVKKLYKSFYQITIQYMVAYIEEYGQSKYLINDSI